MLIVKKMKFLNIKKKCASTSCLQVVVFQTLKDLPEKIVVLPELPPSYLALVNSALIHLASDPPIVSLRLGLELGSQAIEESKDVYFECKIKANPEIYKISWTHNVCVPGK